MIKINVYNSKRVSRNIFVEDNPFHGTLGNLILLKEQYKLLDETWGIDETNYEKVKLHTEFLNEMLAKYGELHCEYCGKQNLKIFHFRDKPNYSIIATTDHFYAASTTPHLAKEKSNFRVCCAKCNNKKGIDVWECKFPYPEHIF